MDRVGFAARVPFSTLISFQDKGFAFSEVWKPGAVARNGSGRPDCGGSRPFRFFSGNSFALSGPSRYNKNVEVGVRQCELCRPQMPDRLVAID